MTSDEINAELKSRGIPFDPESHWKTREKLLNEARELDNQPSNEAPAETTPADLVDSSNPPVIDTATVDSGEVFIAKSYKELLASLLEMEYGKTSERALELIEQNDFLVAKGEAEGNISLRAIAMLLDDADKPPKTLPTIEPGYTDRLKAFMEPVGAPSLGNKDPAVIEWRRQNWSAEQFKAKYPNA